jgi:hypothetical protein
MKKNGNLMAAALIAVMVSLAVLGCASGPAGPSPEELAQQARQAEQARLVQQQADQERQAELARQAELERQEQELARQQAAEQEMDSWKQEAAGIMSQLEGLDGGQEQGEKLSALYHEVENYGFSDWTSSRSASQTALQAAKDWITAEQARLVRQQAAEKEMDSWKQEAAGIMSQLEGLDGGQEQWNKLSGLYQDVDSYGVNIWISNRFVGQAILQTAKDWITLAAINAKGVTADDFEYDVTRSGDGIMITRYKGFATIVNIPAVIEGFPVKEIGGYILDYDTAKKYWDNPARDMLVGAFFGNREITSVTIPDSVTTIEGRTFWPCTSLMSVTLSSSLKSIPNDMFYGCTSLETIILPSSLTTIGNSAFGGCTALETVAFSDSITEIRSGAFRGCTALTALILPKNLRSLNDSVFENCTGLTSVTFQSKNLQIQSSVFTGCTALTTLIINENMNVQGYFLKDCPITTVTIGPNVTKIQNVDLIPQGNMDIATRAALNRLR